MACSSSVGGSQGSRAGTAFGSVAGGSSASGRLGMLPVVESPSRLEAKSSMKLCTTCEGCWASQSRTACGKADIRLAGL